MLTYNKVGIIGNNPLMNSNHIEGAWYHKGNDLINFEIPKELNIIDINYFLLKNANLQIAETVTSTTGEFEYIIQYKRKNYKIFVTVTRHPQQKYFYLEVRKIP